MSIKKVTHVNVSTLIFFFFFCRLKGDRVNNLLLFSFFRGIQFRVSLLRFTETQVNKYQSLLTCLL